MSSFGRQVRVRLIECDKNQVWLANEINKRTGLFCDSAYLSKVLKGDRNPPKVISAIKEILEIEEG